MTSGAPPPAPDQGQAGGEHLQERAVRSAAWALLQTWGSRVVSMIVIVILGRLLAPADFGLVALASAFVELGYWLADGGFSKALVARDTLDDALLSTALWTAVAMGATLCLGVSLLAPLLAGAVGEPDLVPLVRLLSLNYLFVAFGAVPLALLQRELRFRAIALRQLLSTVVAAIAGCALAFAGAGVYALVAQTLGSAVCSLVVLWSSTRWRPRLTFSPSHFRELFGFGSKVLGAEVLSFAGRRGDDILIGTALGATELGYYTIAYRILTIATELLTGGLGSVAFPVFARLRGDHARTRRAYLGVVRMSATFALPAFLGLALLAPEVLATVFGPQWLPAVPALRVLCVAGCLFAVTYSYRDLLIANGRAHWVVRYLAGSVPLLLIAFAVGSLWGILGVAIARTLMHFALHGVDLSMVRRVAHFSVRDYAGQYLRPLWCAGCMVAALAALRSVVDHPTQSPAAVILFVGSGAALYVGALRLFARSLLRELVGHAQQLGPVARMTNRLRAPTLVS